ncbi:unnamed protein product [Amoebophrya sp. A25]|nr:unnamed protein product [Amoebophrya sp. A25]|eukprot:GSA25T00012724001.1
MFLNQVALEARRSSDFFNNLIQAWERKHVCGAPVYREVHFRSWEKRERAKQVLHHRACRPLEILGYWKKPYFWRGAFVAVFVEDGRYCKMLRIGEMPRIDGKGATRRESSWRLSHCSQYPQRGLYVLGLEKSSSHPTKLTPKREKSVQA